MAKSCSLCDHVMDLLEPLGEVRTRAMFGGHGVYHRDLMFGLIDDDVLYLKVDAETRDRYTARGLRPFTYPSPKGPMEMAYHEAPPEALDDGEMLQEWVRSAIDVASRARAAKASGGRKKAPASAGATAKKAAKPKRPSSPR